MSSFAFRLKNIYWNDINVKNRHTTLRHIQLLQLVWVGLGIGYNSYSFWLINVGEPALSPTAPLHGALFMIVCGSIIVWGYLGELSAYKLSLPILITLLLYSGLWLHLSVIAQNAEFTGYSSTYSWAAAVLINSYGTVTLLTGLIIAWRTKTD
ncbi:hypothetical protein [Arenicella sp. 4NH20-0111]|uniref:hypothetical protein n=1 Tax=Arenicella sp. 4NH20-0111 TaxID=3127648 RepID=UPI00333F0B09